MSRGRYRHSSARLCSSHARDLTVAPLAQGTTLAPVRNCSAHRAGRYCKKAFRIAPHSGCSLTLNTIQPVALAAPVKASGRREAIMRKDMVADAPPRAITAHSNRSALIRNQLTAPRLNGMDQIAHRVWPMALATATSRFPRKTTKRDSRPPKIPWLTLHSFSRQALRTTHTVTMRGALIRKPMAMYITTTRSSGTMLG